MFTLKKPRAHSAILSRNKFQSIKSKLISLERTHVAFTSTHTHTDTHQSYNAYLLHLNDNIHRDGQQYLSIYHISRTRARSPARLFSCACRALSREGVIDHRADERDVFLASRVSGIGSLLLQQQQRSPFFPGATCHLPVQQVRASERASGWWYSVRV